MAFTGYSAAADTITFTAGPNAGGNLGNNLIKTTIENDIVDLANVGVINLNTWTGDDTILVRGNSLATLDLDGGTGVDTLKLENAILSFENGGSITAVEQVLFDTGNSSITFTQAQLNAGVVPAIVGGANADAVVITSPVIANGVARLDASALVLSSWTEGVDTLTLKDNANGLGTSFTGSSHRDTILGNDGNDTLNGKGGADQLFGGTGVDKFVFDAVALSDAQSGIFDSVKDYNQGGGAAFSSGEGDQIDLSALLSTAYNHGAGQPVSSLVRAVEDASGTFANLQIDTDGTANGVNWTTIARLDGIQTGNTVNVILDSTLPGGSNVTASSVTAGSISINDVSIAEGNSGTTVETFTVTRSGGTEPFAVNFATSDGTATVADHDYVANAGTLNFAAGVNTQTISVTINGDTWFESNDTFSVNLSGATNGASIGDGQGIGTISNDDPVFASPIAGIQNFGFLANGGGWTNENQYPRQLADVNGDGMADIVGFGADGVIVSLATGNGHFASPVAGIQNFGFLANGGGWTSEDQYPRLLADVNGDHMADIVGFSADGAIVSLATGNGHFASPIAGIQNFGFLANGGGWTNENQYPRQLADVNGDGMADIVGFGADGVIVSLATGNGHFASPVAGIQNFGFLANGGGWTNDNQYPRQLADVNGDGMADIVGFGADGVIVSLATGNGHFASPVAGIQNFGFLANGGGWTSENQYPRLLADVNGDHMADIVGFGADGVIVSLATGNGHFASPVAGIQNFGFLAAGGGWTSQDQYPRQLADVNGDHMADIVGFGADGVLEALSNGFHLI